MGALLREANTRDVWLSACLPPDVPGTARRARPPGTDRRLAALLPVGHLV